MIPVWQWLPYTIAILQLGAGAIYIWHGEWRLALVWLPLAASNWAFAGIR